MAVLLLSKNMKIKIFLLILIKVLINKIKIKTKLPANIKLIVFDSTSINDIDGLVKKIKKIILGGRLENTNEIYFNFTILKEIKKFYKKGGDISFAYYAAIINLIKPNLVLSWIDNSWMFSRLTKIFYKEINFLAIQNAVRYEMNFNDNLIKKKIIHKKNKDLFFYDQLCTFGDYELDHYKKKNIFYNSGTKVGSLRLSNFFNNIKKIKIKSNKYKYDICLISDAIIDGVNERHGIPDFSEDYAKSLKCILQIVKGHNLKLIFCLKRTVGEPSVIELNYYKKFLSDEDFNFLMQRSVNRLSNYNISYSKMLESNLTIALYSSMLRENIALGRKSLSVDFIKGNSTNFPIGGICQIKRPSFKRLQARILKILSISEKEYIKMLNGKNEYLIYSNVKNTKNLIVNKLNKLIKNDRNLRLHP